MVTLEYKNPETQQFFINIQNKIDAEERQQQIETAKLRRGLVLLKAGLWLPDWRQ